MARTITIPPSPTTPLAKPLRHDLTAHLLDAHAIPDLQSTFLQTGKETGWLDKLRERTTHVLKVYQHVGDGQSTLTPNELMKMLVKEAMEGSKARHAGQRGLANGTSGREREEVEIPERMISEGIKVVRRALNGVVVVDMNMEEED